MKILFIISFLVGLAFLDWKVPSNKVSTLQRDALLEVAVTIEENQPQFQYHYGTSSKVSVDSNVKSKNFLKKKKRSNIELKKNIKEKDSFALIALIFLLFLFIACVFFNNNKK